MSHKSTGFGLCCNGDRSRKSAVKHWRRQFVRGCHATGRRSVRIAVRLLLVLSLWHAPIPWVHAHDLEGPDVEHTAPLLHHVSEHHSHDVAIGMTHCAWHSHLVVPGECHRHEGCPAEHRHGDDADDIVFSLKFEVAPPTAPVHLTGCPDQPTWLSADLLQADSSTVRMALARAAGEEAAVFRHVLESYGRSASPTALWGVILC